MIEVNLLNNKGESREQDFSGDFSPSDGMEEVDQKDLVIKFFIILAVPLLMLLYERYNLSSLKSDHQAAEGELTKLKKQAKKLELKSVKYKDINTEVGDLKNRLQALKKLSRNRLSLLRALDDLQSSLSEQIWVNTISFSEGSVILNGYATADESLSVFEGVLEGKIGYSNVVIVKNEEVRQGKAVLQRFQINSDLKGGSSIGR